MSDMNRLDAFTFTPTSVQCVRCAKSFKTPDGINCRETKTVITEDSEMPCIFYAPAEEKKKEEVKG